MVCGTDIVNGGVHHHIHYDRSVVIRYHILQTLKMSHRAVVMYVVMHTAIDNVSAAHHIDHTYAKQCELAAAAGVEFYALSCNLSSSAIEPNRPLPVVHANTKSGSGPQYKINC